MHGSIVVLGLLAGIQSVVAQSTSLYIPGFDAQPVSADIAGVDSQGHTTWVLHPGDVTAAEEQGFIGAVTLVEGSDVASLTYANSDLSLTLGYACTISSGQAVCSGSDGDGTAFTETETVSSFAVQLGATAAATGASASNTGSSSPSKSSGSASGSSSGSSSGSAATASQTSNNSNSSTKQIATSCGSLLGVAALLLALL